MNKNRKKYKKIRKHIRIFLSISFIPLWLTGVILWTAGTLFIYLFRICTLHYNVAKMIWKDFVNEFK
jgi:cytochrome b subunit of formate dehydrogenase